MIPNRGSIGRWGPLVVGLAVVVATGIGGAALMQPPSGEAILDNVEQRYESAETVVGTAEVVAENDSETVRATVQYVATADNETRLTVTRENRTVVLGTNGTVAWTYQPATGLVQVADNETRAERLEERYETRYEDRLERFEENLTATRTGTETVDGTETYVLDVTSENESIEATGTLWVSTDNWTVRKSKLTGENGTVTVTLERPQFNASVHESTFRPPSEDGRLVEGAERDTYDSFEETQAGTDLTVPDLRDSYAFEEGIVAGYGNTTTATVAYGTDAGTVYVAVSTAEQFPAEAGNETTVAGRTVTAIETDRGSVVHWSADGTTTAVLTRGPLDTAREVAETILG